MRTPQHNTKYIKWNLLGIALIVSIAIGTFGVQMSGYGVQRADAATGVIDALNVGTCLATDASVFEDETCHLSDRSDGWDIRDEIEEVRTLYATYAHDPKTGWDEPRAILEDTDLLKISIYDPDRDKRTGVLVRGEGHAEIVGDLAEIRRLLRNRDLIASDEDTVFESGTRLTVRDSSGVATIPTSGSRTLNFEFGSSYKPMDGDSNIRFFGCVTDPNLGACSLSSSGDDRLTDVSDSIGVDEDRVSGSVSPSVAPWLAVNASVPASKNVLIHAIFYETSGRETMVGDRSYYHCGGSSTTDPTRERNDVWRCGGGEADERDGSGDVQYTRNEIDGNDQLLLLASSDGDRRAVNLHLEETGLFTGRYEGYVRLTDTNGDGRYSSSDTQSTNWGARVRDAEGSGESNAAVLGVASGPVTIEYRDSGGRRRTLRIAIDYEPPRIEIDQPRHASSSDDHSPDFIGSFDDNDSGLARDSFRLVVDNDSDSSRNFALDRIVPTFNVRGSGPNGSVSRREDYVGYNTSRDDPFGVIDPRRLFDLGDDSCSRNQDRCYIEADDYRDGASSGRFDDSVRLRLGGDEQEFGVDFQAFVVDIAGNVGFSDADRDDPYFIDDLGEEDPRDRNQPNVLGYLSAHIVGLDEKDPEISTERSATGYYGRDRDDDPVPDRRGVMLVFDGPINPSSIGLNTFYVELDDGSEADVVDVDVDEEHVFLKLADELDSDETPYVGISAGESVRDFAGNITSGRELRRFEANDGIGPRLTVTLSGGSGRGDEFEGPDRLTNSFINIHVESDEPLQGTPTVVVVCESLSWEETVNGRKIEYDVDDFIANRHGAFSGEPREPSGTEYTCGYNRDQKSRGDPFQLTERSMNSRPGENWEVEWLNTRSGIASLEDGRLRIVAFARDRSRHVRGGQRVQSWGAASTDFTLDTEFLSPLRSGGGEVQPEDNSTSTELRPFIFINFAEATTVTLDSVTLDGVEIKDDFTNRETNRFVYWPPSMSRGEHEIVVEATDAAGNPLEFDLEFVSTQRGDFVLDLVTGWNAISVPADPIDTSIETVFTNPAIQAVIGWDTQGWRVAVRRDGVWESSQSFGTLPDIRARYGYWVKSASFVQQPVALRGTIRRSDGVVPSLYEIPTLDGWNFVGVVDNDGDQTEDHFGVSLRDSQAAPVTASDYLGPNFIRAYTWDATFSRFNTLRPSDTMRIGDGVWVFYGGGIAP